jgi:rhodanese-related sulfurtransferase
MKSVFSFLGMVTALLVVAACSQPHKNPSLLVINVLGAEQYNDAHIKGSINVPFDQVEAYAKKLDQKTEVVFYCANYMCSASGTAAEIFKKLGFEKVWAYEGGTAEWYQLGYPIDGAATDTYLKAENKKPAEEGTHSYGLITAQELKKKMDAVECDTCPSCCRK